MEVATLEIVRSCLPLMIDFLALHDSRRQDIGWGTEGAGGVGLVFDCFRTKKVFSTHLQSF